MKPSEKVKLLGFKSMEEVAQISEESRFTLIRWAKERPRRFDLIMKGLAFEKALLQVGEVFDVSPENGGSVGDKT